MAPANGPGNWARLRPRVIRYALGMARRVPSGFHALFALLWFATAGCDTIGLSESDDDISWDDDDGSDDDDDGGPDDDDDTWTPGVDVGGDTCEDATDLGALADDGVGLILHEGCSEKGDVDWYTFVADDDLAQDLAEGGDHCLFTIEWRD